MREQFGQKIGSFQAIKHLCAEMLETAEAVTAAAWDVAVGRRRGDDEQWAFAADVAGAVAFDGAVAGRQGLHPGARRDRLHLRARRAPLPAPGAGAARLLGDGRRGAPSG